MPKVLLSDFNYPDLELERELFGAAGVDLATAQCKTEDDVITAARDCAGILLQYAPITERVVASLPQLAVVSRVGAGFDTVDTDACASHGIWVANAPDYGVGEVATHALGSGKLAGIGLDVLPTEPVPANSKLLGHPRVILTPHAAFYSAESERELRRKAAQNIITWLSTGRPDYVVTAGTRKPQRGTMQ